jgi:hypothetical protein
MIAKSLLEAVYSQIFPDSAAKGHMSRITGEGICGGG